VNGSGLSDDERRELLDAYLDGELDADEREQVDDLLARSATARAELDEIDRVRSMVRALPAVDAPFRFYERMTTARRRRAPGLSVAIVGAVAAAIVLVVAISPVGNRLAPPVEDLGRRHAMLASSSTAMPEGYTEMDAEEMDEQSGFEMPPTANGYRRMHVYDAPDGVHVVYGNGSTMVSVFEQRGSVEWSDLPAGGSRTTMDGDDAWVSSADSAPPAVSEVVVLARDGLVVTVLGGAPHDDVMAIAEAVPDPPAPSMLERLGDACSWVAEGFGFPD
jgi:hypothetical protein